MTGPVLVTGATGTVGREVVRRLAAAQVPVRAATRDPAGSAALWGPEVARVQFDLVDRTSWAAALDGVTTMFLVRPPAMADVRADILPFLDAAVAAGVTHVTFLSVQGAQLIPMLPHRRIERHLDALGVAWTFLRPGYFLQNLLTVHREEIRDRGEIFVPAGNGRTAFVDTEDVAEVAVLALTGRGHERRAYELTGTRAAGYAEVATVLTEALDHPVRYSAPSARAYVHDQRRRGLPTAFVVVTLVLYSTARLGLAAHVTPELQQLLGRPPRELRDFVERHAAQWNHPAPA